jgi:hypothetical protein
MGLNAEKLFLALKSSILAAVFFSVCFGWVVFFVEGSKLEWNPVIAVFFIFLSFSLAGLGLVELYVQRFRAGRESIAINKSLSSDEGYRNTINWCVSFGVIIVLLTTGVYLVLALTTELLPYYYAYLSGALIPISPWAARIALDPYRQLVTGKTA